MYAKLVVASGRIQFLLYACVLSGITRSYEGSHLLLDGQYVSHRFHVRGGPCLPQSSQKDPHIKWKGYLVVAKGVPELHA